MPLGALVLPAQTLHQPRVPDSMCCVSWGDHQEAVQEAAHGGQERRGDQDTLSGQRSSQARVVSKPWTCSFVLTWC